MQPDNFEDISAALALYRPGPMGANSAHQLRPAQERQAGRSPPIHPELEPSRSADILGRPTG
jgi:DNA polymerase-3 subunit alpha